MKRRSAFFIPSIPLFLNETMTTSVSAAQKSEDDFVLMANKIFDAACDSWMRNLAPDTNRVSFSIGFPATAARANVALIEATAGEIIQVEFSRHADLGKLRSEREARMRVKLVPERLQNEARFILNYLPMLNEVKSVDPFNIESDPYYLVVDFALQNKTEFQKVIINRKSAEGELAKWMDRVFSFCTPDSVIRLE